jgi:hypothetical protein
VKVLVKVGDRSPKEPNRRRGHGCWARLIASSAIADHEPGKDLEVDVCGAGAGLGNQSGRSHTPTARRTRNGDESFTPGAWEETPEAKTLDVGVG